MSNTSPELTIVGISMDAMREPWLAAIHQEGIGKWGRAGKHTTPLFDKASRRN